MFYKNMIPARCMTRLLKVIFLLSTASFLIIQFQVHILSRWDGSRVLVNSDGLPQNENGVGDKRLSDIRNQNAATTTANIRVQDNAVPEPPAVQSIKPLAESKIGPGSAAGLPSIDEIRQIIEYDNAHAEILNEEQYGRIDASEGVAGSVSHIVVVQVHNRPKYLEKLIDSLSATKAVERILLIFSHDYYSPIINQLIRGIKFCRVLQIFYPYSIQLFPDRFPGQDPKDCPANMPKDEAAQKQCLNWQHPDKYGHYRVASISQVKHHWWWKINYVFDGVPRLRNFSGWTLFVEEDHYVSPDVFHVLDYTIKHKEELCAECRVIALGVYLKTFSSFGGNINQLAVYPWFSSRHNMGMAVNRVTWNQWRACAHNFCIYDDYNWDWSLMHVNLKCQKPGPMSVLYTKAPRVFHIGDCGIHHTGKQCTADTSANKVKELLQSVKDKLFPESLSVAERSRRTLKAPKENGGWGDVRDHQLCMNHTQH